METAIVTTPNPRFANAALVIILAVAVGLAAALVLGQIRTSSTGAPASQVETFSTQTYAELSAAQAFSTQDYADQHAAPAAAQAFSTQDYAHQHE